MISSKFSLSIAVVLLLGLPISRLDSISLGSSSVLAQTIPRQLRQAYTLLNQGDVNGAIAIFERTVQRYPQSWQAKLGLAIAYRRQGLIEKAWQAYNRVVEQVPNNELALKTLGELAEYRQEWQSRGVEALTALLEINPDDLNSRAQRALLLTYQGNLDLAQQDYKIVLQNNPTRDNLVNAAQVYAYTNQSQKAIELFERYRTMGGKITGNAKVAYARALRQTNNPSSAIEILQAELNSSELTKEQKIQARGELAVTYLGNRQREQALAALEPLRRNKQKQAQLILARSLHEIGQRTNEAKYSEEAAAIYQEVLAQNPNSDRELIREVADVLGGIPQHQEFALQLYQSLVTQQPDNQIWLLQQLALESQLGMTAPAQLRSQLQSILYTLPTDPLEQKQLAQALIRFDPPDPELLPIYHGLTQTVTDVPFLYFRIAQMFLQTSNLAAARQALGAYAATPSGTTDLTSELLLAEIERREGNIPASIQRYSNLIASQPKPEVEQAALRGLAGVYVSQNRLRDALGLFDRLAASADGDLKVNLAQASLGYQLGIISEPQAEAILDRWLAAQPVTNTPPELISLVVALPPSRQREAFYQRLLHVEPNNTDLQLRYIQAISLRSPGQAKMLLQKLIASNPYNLGSYFVQGKFAREIGDLDLAVNSYQNILVQQPDNIDAMSALGGVRFQQRQLDRAQALYVRALDFRPEAFQIQKSLASLKTVQDRPLAALEQLEQLQVKQLASGSDNTELDNQIQQLHQGFLRRRGFQPPWERYGFEE